MGRGGSSAVICFTGVHSSFCYLGTLFWFLLSAWVLKGSGQCCPGPRNSDLLGPNVNFQDFCEFVYITLVI